MLRLIDVVGLKTVALGVVRTEPLNGMNWAIAGVTANSNTRTFIMNKY